MIREKIAELKEIHLLVLVLLALSAVSYFFVFSSKLAEVRRLQAEVVAANADMEAALSAWEEMSRTSRSDIDILEKRVAQWRSKVPESPETESLLQELGRDAARHRLRSFRLSIPAERSASMRGAVAGPSLVSGEAGEGENRGPGEIRLQLAFFSTYRDMAEFFDGVPKMRRLLSVNTLTVREKDGEMETDVELSAFYRRPAGP
ncbi:MAG: hypothetical protein WBA34_08705 [Candidatus Deferrimicrobiaceae bacterium]